MSCAHPFTHGGAATPFGPILAVSNVLLASLWLWFTINGYLSGRDRRFVSLRRYMVLSATLALSIITNRIWTPILFIALHPLQDSAFHGDEELFLWGWRRSGWAGRSRRIWFTGG